MSTEYGVQAAAFTEAIHVGRLNKARTMFLADKQEATDMVLAAVAQFVERNFDGGMETTFPSLGLRLTVHVEPATADTDTRATEPATPAHDERTTA